MAKINSDKILKELQKGDLENQVAVFHVIKNYLSAKFAEKAQELEEEKEKYLSIKDTISK